MGSIRKRDDNENLFFDFRFKGLRCREQTALPDTKANRAKLQKLLDKIQLEIKSGTFDYAKTFPGSHLAVKFLTQDANPLAIAKTKMVESVAAAIAPSTPKEQRPTVTDFSKTWIAESEVSWRRSHRRTVGDIVSGHVLPVFGAKLVDEVSKADILAFRSTLAKLPGRKAETLSPKRINAIMAVLRQLLNEAADRFEFTTPFRNIKPLRMVRPDVEPFTFDEVRLLLATVQPEFLSYYTVRIYTGMRTGEIDGLKWEYVDFDRRQILIRETIVLGEEDITKTDGSVREIQMSNVVYDALIAQKKVTHGVSKFVFANSAGQPLDHNNMSKRVWYPLLKQLGLKARRPYQTRHTAATLWLSAGENPLWIARQLGHSSTEMLFKVYGRFVPNMTRQDGSAFERLLLQSRVASPTIETTEPSNTAAPSHAKADQS